jgi:CDGSH-type Zn-finger protein
MDLPKQAGDQPLIHEAKKDQVYAWCSCGLSDNQPFCNGAHAGSNFSPTIMKETEDKNVYLCTCKKSSNPPYCDGSHSKI